MFVNITDAVHLKKPPQKRIVQHTLHQVRSTLQTALVDDLLQIRCKAVGIDSGKQITANPAMRQDINQLLQPESLLPLESSTVFPVGGNIEQQLFPNE